MIHPEAIDHTCLVVTSLDAAHRQFADWFDFTFTLRAGDPQTLVVESENVHFFLMQIEDAPETFLRLQHISFRVSNLDEVIERLRLTGIDDFTTGMVDFFAHQNYRWCEWRGPDGIRVECVELI